MILGQSVELTVDAQMVVSRWAAKTAVMFHYAYHALAAMPMSRLQQIRNGHEPPEDVGVC